MEEIWKDVIDYENFYMISNYGRVKSLERIDNNNHLVKEKYLKDCPDDDGHTQVTIYKDKTKKALKIHRTVAEYFIPNPENKPDVHHIDHNPFNNRVDNLMWVTKEEHAKLHPERYEKAKETRQVTILQIDKTTNEVIAEYPSMAEASRITGVSISGICQVCKGIRNKSGGFIWKYKNEGN